MTKQMHIERVSKLNIKQINSVLTEISEESGVFNREILVDILLKGRLEDFNNDEWQAIVKKSTEWFDGWLEFFETKEEVLEFIKNK
jgi:regulator of RNase E activity RraB